MERERKRRLGGTFGSVLIAGVIASGFAASSASAATFTVSNLNDSGAGSLRQAISDANGAAGTDDIAFGPGVTGTIQLQSQLPNISQPLSIIGPGADQLTVRRAGTATDFRIFTMTGTAAVTISGLTISNGSAIADFQPNSEGGAIRSTGPLTIDSSAITNNRASLVGGIAAIGDLTLRNSTVSGNTTGSGIGGIYGLANVTIVNSTITGNAAEGSGSAGGVETFGSTQIRNSTIAGNTNQNPAGTANLANLGSMLVTSTIVADPLGGAPNCSSSGPVPSGGFNLESANSCGFAQISDQHNTDPHLGRLAFNGGPTKTMALPPTSAAVDRGSAAGTTADQRAGLAERAQIKWLQGKIGLPGSRRQLPAQPGQADHSSRRGFEKIARSPGGRHSCGCSPTGQGSRVRKRGRLAARTRSRGAASDCARRSPRDARTGAREQVSERRRSVAARRARLLCATQSREEAAEQARLRPRQIPPSPASPSTKLP